MPVASEPSKCTINNQTKMSCILMFRNQFQGRPQFFEYIPIPTKCVIDFSRQFFFFFYFICSSAKVGTGQLKNSMVSKQFCP